MRELWQFVNRCKERDDVRTLPKHLRQITERENENAQHNNYIIANIPTFLLPNASRKKNIQLGLRSLEYQFKSGSFGFRFSVPKFVTLPEKIPGFRQSLEANVYVVYLKWIKLTPFH